MKNKNHIESIVVETKPDHESDLSHLGTYGNQRMNRWSIERENPGRNEYRWFNPNANNYGGCTDEEIAKYCRQDYKRAEAFNAGKWSYIGIKAKAVVVSGRGLRHTLRSGGLWGIESDSPADYMAQVQQDELADLRAELAAFGFSARAIDYAFKHVMHR